MIPLRDRLFLGSDVVLLLGPLSDRAIGGAEGALRRLARAPGWTWLAAPFPVQGAAPDLSTTVLDAALDDASVVRAVRAVGLGGGSARLAVAGDRLVLLLSHAAADGTEALALLTAVLAVACGEPPPPVAEPVRAPLLRAIRRVGLGAFGRYAGSRRERLAGSQGAAPTTGSGPARLVHVALDPARLAALRAIKSSGGRATTSTRLISAAVTGLAEAGPGAGDLPVRIPIDLRALAGGRVRGTFVSVQPHGGLRSADWSPGAIAARIAEHREQAVPALVAAIARSLRPGRGETGGGEQSISISVVPPVAVPDRARGPVAPILRCATIAPVPPSSTFVLIAAERGGATVSVWDETGLFDLDRLTASLAGAPALRG